MKRCIVIVLFICFASNSNSAIERPKIGLVLGGGGAKGFAHIGTLKLIDSLNIPIDYIVGTSIGGIAGGLYSIGYSGDDLEKLVHETDWEEIFSDTPERQLLPYFVRKESGRYQLTFGLRGFKPMPPRGLINGQKISLLLSSLTFPYENVEDFDHLPIPFRPVAVDLVTGNEVILRSGSLAKALRATMAIPTVFSPVDWGDSLLVDGGLLNNLPVDVIKEMGADIVIAVDLSSPLKSRQELGSAIEILEQTISIYDREKWTRNVRQADIFLHPDLALFTAADFAEEEIDQILAAGECEARAHLDEFIELVRAFDLQTIQNDSDTVQFDAYGISAIRVVGNFSLSDQEIKTRLAINEHSVFDPVRFQNQIRALRETYYVKQLDYHLTARGGDSLDISIKITEKQKPVIKSIHVRGQRMLPFSFIYHLLGIQPGDSLDTKNLNQRIMDAYALGYFENITYTIEPVDANHVDLTIFVREAPHRKLRLGLRYSDRHQLVAAAGLLANNFLLPGLRWEYEIQFAGLKRMDFKVSYPSRTMNLPVYPFFSAAYKDIPMHIYDVKGERVATYDDNSTSLGAGMGFLFEKYANLEVQFEHEAMKIEPAIAPPSELLEYPVWRDGLNKINCKLDIDRLDDVLLPRHGTHLHLAYELSLKSLGSDVSYSRFQAALNIYRTLSRRHTMRLYGALVRGYGDLPPYKEVPVSRPHMLVGLGYDELIVRDVYIARIDYRYQYKRDIFFKLIANAALDIHIPGAMFPYESFYPAVAAGVKLLSPIGPIELVYSVGKRDLSKTNALQDQVYFTMGYKF